MSNKRNGRKNRKVNVYVYDISNKQTSSKHHSTANSDDSDIDGFQKSYFSFNACAWFNLKINVGKSMAFVIGDIIIFWIRLKIICFWQRYVMYVDFNRITIKIQSVESSWTFLASQEVWFWRGKTHSGTTTNLAQTVLRSSRRKSIVPTVKIKGVQGLFKSVYFLDSTWVLCDILCDKVWVVVLGIIGKVLYGSSVFPLSFEGGPVEKI